MFYPGETEYETFTLPFAASEIRSVLVSYKQGDRVILEKNTTGKEAIDEFVCRVSLSLTQLDTMKFRDDEDISIQLNVMTTSGTRVVSTPITMSCGPQYHRVVI